MATVYHPLMPTMNGYAGDMGMIIVEPQIFNFPIFTVMDIAARDEN